VSDFKGRHFKGEIVLWAVRWYCRYGVSYRDLEQMMGERGVSVTSWRVDETYIKVRGQWAYLYRAVDKFGDTIDFYLSSTRNTAATKRFLGKALNGLKQWELPHVVNTAKAPTYATALAELKKEGKCPEDTIHRQAKYLNNVVEADHGKLKQLIRPVRGFKTLKTAYTTIKGFEVMRALRKGQAGAFNLSRDICGEVSLIERAFGLGACVLTEAVEIFREQLQAA
jgi:transposase, IS6 family